jgi:hypothetical protein
MPMPPMIGGSQKIFGVTIGYRLQRVLTIPTLKGFFS